MRQRRRCIAGAFYIHFESQQAVFVELLPHFGLEMLDELRERVRNIRGSSPLKKLACAADHLWFC